MKPKKTTWTTPLAAAGALLVLAAVPAAATPAQSFAPLKTLALEQTGAVEQVHWRRGWHRNHCHWVKRCWHHRGHRHCNWVRRCW